MPDYPYVYGTAAPRPVEPGGTRIRVFRRRREEQGEEGGEEAADRWAAWEEALAEAVEELNRDLEAQGSGVRVHLAEEEGSLFLTLTGLPGALPSPLPSAPLDPADLPRWFARLRSHLGLLVDETA
ncbi:hypothetical protein [Deferrisoma palaeochoriense]